MLIPKSSHLILLVGSNPIPNAVAAKLLAQSDAKITLIYTSKLSKLAERLKTWVKKLSNDYQVQLQGPIDESSAEEIQKAIEKALESGKKENKNACISLHYTGGTKAMSVHAYRAIERWCEENHLPKPTCSYLDPRKLELIFDPGGQSIAPVGQRERLIDQPRLTLQDMLELHGWEKKDGNEPKTESLLPNTAQVLLEIHQKEELLQAWNNWLIWEFIPETHSSVPVNRTVWVPDEKGSLKLCRGAKWDNKLKGISGVVVNWPSDSCLTPIKESLKNELHFNEKALDFSVLNDQIAPVMGTDRAKKCREYFVEWLLGEWLESATLEALNQCKKSRIFHECYRDLKAERKDPDENVDPHFQLDVLALRGYRLFAFSCTTETETNLIKLKLFEVYLRARQLGGDQARVAMISCCEPSKAQAIQAEVLRDLEEMGANTRVFSHDCLGDLAGRIKNWIENLEQPA